MPKTATYIVRAVFDARDAGQTFGPFETRESAEQCAIVLAGRDNVLSVSIEERVS